MVKGKERRGGSKPDCWRRRQKSRPANFHLSKNSSRIQISHLAVPASYGGEEWLLRTDGLLKTRKVIKNLVLIFLRKNFHPQLIVMFFLNSEKV